MVRLPEPCENDVPISPSSVVHATPQGIQLQRKPNVNAPTAKFDTSPRRIVFLFDGTHLLHSRLNTMSFTLGLCGSTALTTGKVKRSATTAFVPQAFKVPCGCAQSRDRKLS